MSSEGLDKEKYRVDLEKYTNPKSSRLALTLHLKPIDIATTIPNQKLVSEVGLKIKYDNVNINANPMSRKQAGRKAMCFSKDKEPPDTGKANQLLSPKSAKSKFKECFHQSNLNRFLVLPKEKDKHLKHPQSPTLERDANILFEPEVDAKTDSSKALNGFKVSNNLFMSPGRKKLLRNAKKSKKSSKNNHYQDENVVEVLEAEVAPTTVIQDGEDVPVKESEPEVVINTDLQEKPSTPRQDVFKLLMDNQNKIIGSNSMGKKLQFSPTSKEELSISISAKDVLKQRKHKFEEWAQIKGSKKRKLDKTRDQNIRNILDSRAKRMKEMLEVQAENSQEIVSTRKSSKVRKSRILRIDDDEDKNSTDSTIIVPDKEVGKIETEEATSTNIDELELTLSNKTDDNMAKSTDTTEETSKSEKQTQPTVAETKIPSRLSLKSAPNTNLDITIDEFTFKSGNCELSKKDSPKSTLQIPDDPEIVGSSTTQPLKGKGSRGPYKKKLKKSADIGDSLPSKITFSESVDVLEITNDEKPLRRSSRLRKSVLHEDYDDFHDEDAVVEVASSIKPNKSMKLAPIFAKAKAKQKLDPKALEARNKFLYSGVPDNLKRSLKQNLEIYELEQFQQFPKVSHVQQKCDSRFWNLSATCAEENHNLPELDREIDFSEMILKNEWDLGLLDQHQLTVNVKLNIPLKEENLDADLERIKNEMSHYPVYRCFKTLRERNGFIFKQTDDTGKSKKSKRRSHESIPTPLASIPVDEFTMWTEKYKANSSREIIGNQRTIGKLKKWLNSWLQYSDEFADKNKRKRRDCDSDFESDSTTRDSTSTPGNTMILRGPPGSGKTSAVYAICEELGINVLELNASSRRTGKRLLQEMQEATRSHQVSKKHKETENMLTQFLGKKEKKEKKSHENEEQVQTKRDNKMCVVLIEDVDVVFDQDEGFNNALNHLVVTSKRPIILVATDVGAPLLQKLIMQHPILHFAALSASTLAVYLEILCLVEGLRVDRRTLGQLIEWNKGDVRKTLLQLQFWVTSGGDAENTIGNVHNQSFGFKLDKLDGRYDDYDDSSFLLSGTVVKPAPSDEISKTKTHENCIFSFQTFDQNHKIPMPLDLSVLWWNLPNLLGFDAMSHDKSPPCKQENDGKEDLNVLNSLWNIFDAMSFCDTLDRTERKPFGTEPCPKQWESSPIDSLLLRAPLEEFKSNRMLTEDLEHTLLDGYCKLFIDEQRRQSEVNLKAKESWNFAVPTPQERKWRHKQHSCESMFQDAMTYNVLCERAAFSLDYFPALRTMCRSEARRSTGNFKRGNRFRHYLQTFDLDISASTMRTACNTLTTTNFRIDNRF